MGNSIVLFHGNGESSQGSSSGSPSPQPQPELQPQRERESQPEPQREPLPVINRDEMFIATRAAVQIIVEREEIRQEARRLNGGKWVKDFHLHSNLNNSINLLKSSQQYESSLLSQPVRTQSFGFQRECLR